VRRPGRLLFFGRFFGVPLYFAPSWLVIAALLTISYGPVIHNRVDRVSSSTAYLTAFAYAALFALCVLAHELGHTAVSLALGNPVTRVVIFFLGGVSQIEREPKRPRDEFLIAAAGPAVSAILAAAAFGVHSQLNSDSVAGALADLLLWGNVIVVVFNLLPGLPLDGGRLLRAGVWGIAKSRLTGTRVGAWAGRVLAVVVALFGVAFARNDVTSTVVTTLIAMYLWVGATQSLRAAEVEARLPAVNLATLLRPGLLVPASLSVAEALARVWDGSARGLVTVDSADQPTAIVSEARIGDVPPPQRAWTAVTTVARAIEPGLILPIGLSGDQILDAVRKTPASEYLVVNADGSPAGILAATDLATILKGNT
jgi:Zn-dependent protease